MRHAALAAGAFAVAALMLAPTTTRAEAHGHRGVLPRIDGAPKPVALSKTDLKKLASGGAVRKQVREPTGGRGIVVQDIGAEPKVVWSRIVDFPKYPKMVDNVSECQVYEKKKDHIRTRFVVGGFGLHIEYFIDHIYKPKLGYLKWTLDYDRKSELDDSVGYWLVAPHPDKPGHTRLYYSVRVQTSTFMPGFIEDMIADQGLVKATAWVKREAEKAQKKSAKKASSE